MRAQIKLGSIQGVKIGLHYSWLIIALLITLSLRSHFRLHNSEWGETAIWATAIMTAVLFFTTIVVHELSHVLVAKAHGLPVRSITLFALGGVAEVEKEAPDASTEFWMGIIGPITSFLIGIACLSLVMAFGWAPTAFPKNPFLAGLMWLGYINIGLALFNMVPGFPLDGGRVLRAIIWWITGNARRATRIAARVGQFIAFFLIILGVFQFFGGAGIGGLWIAFIGWFLLEASRASYAHTVITEGLGAARVADLMSHDWPIVDARSNLQIFVDEHLLRTGRQCFAVTENGSVEGLITAREVSEVERARWPYTTVDQVMQPLSNVRTVIPETPVANALEVMVGEDLNQLPVVVDGKLLGLISRGHILQLLQNRAELHM
jgi:Zn-dependent protease/predicted transcriptional regulator